MRHNTQVTTTKQTTISKVFSSLIINKFVSGRIKAKTIGIPDEISNGIKTLLKYETICNEGTIKDAKYILTRLAADIMNIFTTNTVAGGMPSENKK